MTKLEELREYLGNMSSPIKGSVHVNGAPFSNVMLVVDFGNPLHQQKLAGPEVNAMSALMREATKQMTRNPNVQVRIHSDTNNGLVYWTSI